MSPRIDDGKALAPAPAMADVPGYHCVDGKFAIHLLEEEWTLGKIGGPKMRTESAKNSGMLLFEGEGIRLYVTRSNLLYLCRLAGLESS